MRVALKLALAFVLANCLLATLYGYLAVRRQIREFERTVRAEAESVGPAIEGLATDAWRNAGDQGLRDLVRKTASRPSQMLEIRWVWFDAGPSDADSPAVAAHLLSTVAIEQHQVIADPRPDGNDYMRVYWPIRLAAARRGGLEISEPAAELRADENEIVYRTALLIGGMVLISGILAVILGVRFIGTPLRKLSDKAHRVAAGDLQTPVRLDSHDELSELAESMNQMCGQLCESQAQVREETAARMVAMDHLRHADRLSTVGRLAAGIAHELGTPLNVVAGRAGLIQSGKLGPDEIGQSAAAIKAEADKMTRTIRQLLDFARTSAPRKAPTDLRSVVERTISLVRGLADEHHVQIRFVPGDEPAMAAVDAEQIKQILTNLVVNAIQAMPDGGEVEVTIWRRTNPPPDTSVLQGDRWLAIDVRDTGVGISPGDMPHLFEPFFTTKGVGEGTGLGLAIAYGIIREHSGSIDVASQPGMGSRFTVSLPEGDKS
jgi:two-component system NtrC family sensor kinase